LDKDKNTVTILTIKPIDSSKANDKPYKLLDFKSLYLYITSWKRHHFTFINTLIKLTYSLMFLSLIPIDSKLPNMKFKTSLVCLNKVKNLL